MAITGGKESFASERDRSHNILALYSYNKDMPANILVDQGIQQTFKSYEQWDTKLYAEYMDLTRFSDDEYLDRFRDLLRYKYAVRQIDLIIVVMTSALDFMLQYDLPAR